jgi:hypothetical protein
MSFTVFENIRLKLLNFVQKKKKDQGYFKYKDDRKLKSDTEESSILLDETERNTALRFHNKEEIKHSSRILFNNTLFPMLYFIAGISAVLVMLLKDIYSHDRITEGIFITLEPNKTKFYNFFKLPEISPLLFHIINTIHCAIGMGIVYLVYAYLILKFKEKGLRLVTQIKLHLLLFTGIVSMLLSFMYGVCFITSNLDILNQPIQKYTFTSLPEVVYTLHIFFSIIFCFFSLLFLYELQSKPDSAYFNNDETRIVSSKPINYKLIIIVYIILFSILYIFIKLYKNKLLLVDIKSDFLDSNMDFLYAVLPYSIYLFNQFYFLFIYDEVGSTYTVMVDEESNAFTDREKNMF